MNKIKTFNQAVQIGSKLHKENKHIILAGGCFDLLHIGHISYLEKSKKLGGQLFVFLESDEKITKIKGPNRPINTQLDRAKILSSLTAVDVVILLKDNLTNKDYDEMILKLNPDFITVTKGDIHKHHKEQQAKKTGAKVIAVNDIVSDKSTSRLIKLLEKDL